MPNRSSMRTALVFMAGAAGGGSRCCRWFRTCRRPVYRARRWSSWPGQRGEAPDVAGGFEHAEDQFIARGHQPDILRIHAAEQRVTGVVEMADGDSLAHRLLAARIQPPCPDAAEA